jgi:hypothetical protein
MSWSVLVTSMASAVSMQVWGMPGMLAARPQRHDVAGAGRCCRGLGLGLGQDGGCEGGLVAQAADSLALRGDDLAELGDGLAKLPLLVGDLLCLGADEFLKLVLRSLLIQQRKRFRWTVLEALRVAGVPNSLKNSLQVMSPDIGLPSTGWQAARGVKRGASRWRSRATANDTGRPKLLVEPRAAPSRCGNDLYGMQKARGPSPLSPTVFRISVRPLVTSLVSATGRFGFIL